MHAVYQWQQLEPPHDINTTDKAKPHEHDQPKERGFAPKALAGCPLFHRIVLVGGENVACLLGPGLRHEVLPVVGIEGPTCALLPVIALTQPAVFLSYVVSYCPQLQCISNRNTLTPSIVHPNSCPSHIRDLLLGGQTCALLQHQGTAMGPRQPASRDGTLGVKFQPHRWGGH